MKADIYLDYAATTPVDPKVADAMAECLTLDGVFANPASRSHGYGWQAEEKVETARGQVAELLGCDPREIVWSSGATEANNLALKGVFETANFSGHLITSVIEHKAVIDPAKWLETRGVSVTWLQPDVEGVVSADKVADAIRPDTKLVSLMMVNNEIGSINPIAEIAAVCRERKVLLHVDAAQAVGKLPIDLQTLPVDLLSISAHKFYGPKGIGALFVRRVCQQQVTPQIHGGGHERGLRSGTLPTHQIVGMGTAAKLAQACIPEEMQRVTKLRDKLWRGIQSLPNIRRNSSEHRSSPGHLNICFAGIDNETLLLSLRELAVSSGSACTSANLEPSYVLKAIGLSDGDALASLRISLGRFTTEADIDRAIAHIRSTVSQLRAA